MLLHAPITGGQPLCVMSGWLSPEVPCRVRISSDQNSDAVIYRLTGVSRFGGWQFEDIHRDQDGNYISANEYESLLALETYVATVGITTIEAWPEKRAERP